MGNLNKTYLGYKPKDDNVVKLAQYLAVKNAFKDNKNPKRLRCVPFWVRYLP